MDFGALPPEVNSARMYAGPGSAPMLAAASAWDRLAAELTSSAAAYQSVITELSSQGWTGPAATAMATAAAPYVTWMSTTAGQAEQTGAQAKAAAAAFDAAFAMTVPPPVVAANRAQLASLVATNFLGQNTPAIAATEAHYGQMWAQDAAAMYGYAGSSAVAAQVSPFTAAKQTTNPAGQSNQAGAVANAAGSSTASGVQSTLSQVVSTTPGTLQGLASPLQSVTPASGLDAVGSALGIPPGDVLNGMTNLMSSSFSPMGMAGVTQAGADIAVISGIVSEMGDIGGITALPSLSAAMPALASSTAPALGGAGAVSAGVGQGTLVGALSVPQSWAAAGPVAAPAPPAAGTSLVASWTAAAPAAEAAGAPGMPGMPLAGAGNGRGYGFAAPRYGFKPTVMGRPVVAG